MEDLRQLRSSFKLHSRIYVIREHFLTQKHESMGSADSETEGKPLFELSRHTFHAVVGNELVLYNPPLICNDSIVVVMNVLV